MLGLKNDRFLFVSYTIILILVLITGKQLPVWEICLAAGLFVLFTVNFFIGRKRHQNSVVLLNGALGRLGYKTAVEIQSNSSDVFIRKDGKMDTFIDFILNDQRLSFLLSKGTETKVNREYTIFSFANYAVVASYDNSYSLYKS